MLNYILSFGFDALFGIVTLMVILAVLHRINVIALRATSLAVLLVVSAAIVFLLTKLGIPVLTGIFTLGSNVEDFANDASVSLVKGIKPAFAITIITILGLVSQTISMRNRRKRGPRPTPEAEPQTPVSQDMDANKSEEATEDVDNPDIAGEDIFTNW